MAIFYPPSPAGLAELAWDSLGKRKREYDMARSYYSKKRRLVTGRRRRPMKRYRRSRGLDRYRTGYGLGQKGKVYAGRRMVKGRVYRNKLWTSTAGEKKYRSVDTSTSTLSTPTSNTTKIWGARSMIPNNFFVTPILKGGVNQGFEGVVVVRGGLATITFKNKGDNAVRVELYNVYVRYHAEDSEYPPETTATTNSADDPTTWDQNAIDGQTNGRAYRIIQRRSALIEPGGVWTCMDKIRIQRVQTEDYIDTTRADRRMNYWYSLESPGENTTDAVDIQRTVNMTFTGDSTI